MEIIYSEKAQADIAYWKKSGNTRLMKKITSLLESMLISPLQGIGKPEQLKYELTGKWSRRINNEHRIVYSLQEDIIKIHSLKGHY